MLICLLCLVALWNSGGLAISLVILEFVREESGSDVLRVSGDFSGIFLVPMHFFSRQYAKEEQKGKQNKNGRKKRILALQNL